MPPALETTRQDFQDLFSLYLVIGIAIAVLVIATIAFAVIRYRYREGRDPDRPETLLKVIEGTWIVSVAAIVVVLLVATFTTEDRVDAVPGDPARTVRVVGFQWGWRFSYPGTGVAITGNSERPPTLVVPAGVAVRFEITSRDVVHSFWVPGLRYKRDAFPKRVSDFDLVVDPGVTTTGHCAEFCGLGHDRMDFELVSMDPGRFDEWLRQREHRAAAGVAGDPA
jgi:cytochrome c oxidase subunit II